MVRVSSPIENSPASEQNRKINQSDEWQKVTPKKSAIVMQNKFVVIPKSTDSPISVSPHTRTGVAINRFEALRNSSLGAGAVSGGERGNSVQGRIETNLSSPFSTNSPSTSSILSSGAAAARQKQLENQLKAFRKKMAVQNDCPSSSSSARNNSYLSTNERSFLQDKRNFLCLSSFLSDFDWKNHGMKLENLWFSVMGNPQKFIFILVDYLEDLLDGLFPTITFTVANYTLDLPIGVLRANSIATSAETQSIDELIENFVESFDLELERFLKEKLETPEFKIENVIGSLLEIICKRQKLSQGANSFSSILLLAKLIKTFPFQSFQALKEEQYQNLNLSLTNQKFFYLWLISLVFEEEPSQCTTIFDVLFEFLFNIHDGKWTSLSSDLLQNVLVFMDDLAKEIVILHSANSLLLSNFQTKVMSVFDRPTSATALPAAVKRMFLTMATKTIGPSIASPSAFLAEYCKLWSVGRSLNVSAEDVLDLIASGLVSSSESCKAINKFVNEGIYEEYLGTLSRFVLQNILTDYDIYKKDANAVRELSRAISKIHLNLTRNSKKWTSSPACKQGFSKKDLATNEILLDKINLRFQSNESLLSIRSATALLPTKRSFFMVWGIMIATLVGLLVFGMFAFYNPSLFPESIQSKISFATKKTSIIEPLLNRAKLSKYSIVAKSADRLSLVMNRYAKPLAKRSVTAMTPHVLRSIELTKKFSKQSQAYYQKHFPTVKRVVADSARTAEAAARKAAKESILFAQKYRPVAQRALKNATEKTVSYVKRIPDCKIVHLFKSKSQMALAQLKLRINRFHNQQN